MSELNIEALAAAIAWESVYDHVYGEMWYGHPNPDDAVQMQEAMEGSLPYAREKAERYVSYLTDDDHRDE